MMRLKILVLTDFSEASTAAERYAIVMARRTGAEIKFLYAALRNGTEALVTAAREEFKLRERDMRRRMRGMVSFSTEVISTDNIQKLVNDVVTKENYNLIVMGTHRLGRPNRLLGSTTLRIVQTALVPIIAVPPNVRFRLRRIVVASDSRHLLVRIRALMPFAKIFNAAVTIVNVVSPDQKEHHYEEKSASRNARFPGIAFTTIENHDVAEALQDFLSKKRIDLLTIFPGQHGFLDKILGRSVTREMSFETNIPLLIVNKM